MNIDKAVLLVAGIINLAALALGYWQSPYWLLLSVFVSLNLMQASITGFCPAAMLFRRLGVRSGNAFR